VGGRWWLAVLVRVGAVLMLLGGVACGLASVERWWPECRLGQLESGACGRLQDNLYDYLVPSDPWVPVGSAATLAGVGGLLMGVGLVLLLPNHAAHRGQRLLALVVAVVAFVTLHDSAATYLSGRAGRPVDVSFLTGLRGPWEIMVPFALAALVFRLRATGTRWRGWDGPAPLVVSLMLFVVAPFLGLVFLPLSHDTPPWSGAVTGMSMVVAGCAAWCLPQRAGRRGSGRQASGRQGDGEGRVARPA
jgi:hypothetical protein